MSRLGKKCPRAGVRVKDVITGATGMVVKPQLADGREGKSCEGPGGKDNVWVRWDVAGTEVPAPREQLRKTTMQGKPAKLSGAPLADMLRIAKPSGAVPPEGQGRFVEVNYGDYLNTPDPSKLIPSSMTLPKLEQRWATDFMKAASEAGPALAVAGLRGIGSGGMDDFEAVQTMFDWHGGQGSGFYSVASLMYGGHPVPASSYSRALSEAESLVRRGKGGPEMTALVEWLRARAGDAGDGLDGLGGATEKKMREALTYWDKVYREQPAGTGAETRAKRATEAAVAKYGAAAREALGV